MAIIKNINRVSRAAMSVPLNKIAINPNNSMIDFSYIFTPTDDIDVRFTSTTSKGTYKQVIGGIAGNLSNVLRSKFRQ